MKRACVLLLHLDKGVEISIPLCVHMLIIIDKTKKIICAPSEDSGQPGHPPSLIRVLAVRMKKAWVLSYPLSAHYPLSVQRRLWSDWADAHADLSFHWVHRSFCWFCDEAAHIWYTDSLDGAEEEMHNTTERMLVTLIFDLGLFPGKHGTTFQAEAAIFNEGPEIGLLRCLKKYYYCTW